MRKVKDYYTVNYKAVFINVNVNFYSYGSAVIGDIMKLKTDDIDWAMIELYSEGYKYKFERVDKGRITVTEFTKGEIFPLYKHYDVVKLPYPSLRLTVSHEGLHPI